MMAPSTIVHAYVAPLPALRTEAELSREFGQTTLGAVMVAEGASLVTSSEPLARPQEFRTVTLSLTGLSEPELQVIEGVPAPAVTVPWTIVQV